jgi:hypothetical protein
MTHPSYLSWQIDWPVFVKVPFFSDGKTWGRQDHFNWLERGLDPYKVSILYSTGYIYHNSDLEVKNKVGDRLVEMNREQLLSLVGLLNSEVKKKTTSKNEFEAKKCKSSAIPDKQRGLIRRFLMSNPWITDDFYALRDQILDKKSTVVETPVVAESSEE